MDEKYIYGWYKYADRDVMLRYPAAREDDLRQDGKRVTVEITFGGDVWDKRRGVVSWGGGNFTVTPA